MRDIQRYRFFYDCIEPNDSDMELDNDGDYIKYDDHIAEVVNLEKNYVLQVEQLQTEKKELFDAMQMYCDKARKLEVKQTELQAENKQLRNWYNQTNDAQKKQLQAELDSLKNDPMTKRHYNQIVADGIENLIHKYSYDADEIMPVQLLIDYADKLREGDDE